MKMNLRWYLGGLLLLFAAYVALEYNRPKPVDWRPTLVNKDRIPYGTYVLYDQLPHLLGTDSVATTRLPIYNQLTGVALEASDAVPASPPAEAEETTAETEPAPDAAAADTSASDATDSTAVATADATDSTAAADAGADSTATVADEADDEEAYDDENDWLAGRLRAARANYLFVNTSFAATRTDVPVLLRYVATGHQLFVVAERFDDGAPALLDSLGLRLWEAPLATRRGPRGLPVPDSVAVRFVQGALAGPRYRLPGADANLRLVPDTAHLRPANGPAQALATDEQGRAVLVRARYGRGFVYLCTLPIAFTNQFLLRPATTGFAAAALSYLPARATWWDEYQKQGRAGNQSLLRLVRNHEALNTAWYLLLAGAGLLVLVQARRRQRVIPTLKPLPNTTLLFTRTVASLYRQGRHHGPIAEKKIGLFLDYLRTRFQEPGADLADESFRARLSQKAGVPRPRVDALLRLLNLARTAPALTDAQLLALSRAITEFKRDARR